MKTAEIDAARLRKKQSSTYTGRADWHRGYALCGHAVTQREGIRHSAPFATSDTIARDTKFVEASRLLGLFDATHAAEEAGLARARARIDGDG